MCGCDLSFVCSSCRETSADDVWAELHEPDPPEPFSSEGRNE